VEHPVKPDPALTQPATGNEPIFAQTPASNAQRRLCITRFQKLREHGAEVLLLGSQLSDDGWDAS
jgi:hypothetical protein